MKLPSFTTLLILFALTSFSADAKTIAVLLKAPDNPFYDEILHGAKEQAERLGHIVISVIGKNEDDYQTQIDFLTNSSDKFDGIVLVPTRSNQFKAVSESLAKQKKPLVIVDTPLSEGQENVLTTISSDNRIGGRLAGLFMANQISVEPIKENCVILFSGNPKAKTHQDRNAGFLEVIKQVQPAMKIYSYEAMSSFELARDLTLKNIDQIQKCVGVFAGSDTMILGMLNVFEKQNLREPPISIGYDSIVEVQRKILESKIMASVQQSPSEMGRVAVRSLDLSFHGKPVAAIQTIPPKLTARSFKLDSLTEKDLAFVSPKKD